MLREGLPGLLESKVHEVRGTTLSAMVTRVFRADVLASTICSDRPGRRFLEGGGAEYKHQTSVVLVNALRSHAVHLESSCSEAPRALCF